MGRGDFSFKSVLAMSTDGRSTRKHHELPPFKCVHVPRYSDKELQNRGTSLKFRAALRPSTSRWSASVHLRKSEKVWL